MYNAGLMENARLLRLMGIDVWRPRNPAGVTTTRAPATESASQGADPAPAGIPAGIQAAPAHDDAPQRAAPSGDRVEPFTVVCLSDAGALMLVEAPVQRFPLRFCSDLLRAAGGAGSPQQVVFSWPHPGLEPGTGHSGRSLAAFIDKQLGDSGAVRLLVCARMCERVPDLQWPDPVLKMPQLDRLLLEADLKKALWLQIRQLAAKGVRTPRTPS